MYSTESSRQRLKKFLQMSSLVVANFEQDRVRKGQRDEKIKRKGKGEGERGEWGGGNGEGGNRGGGGGEWGGRILTDAD